MKFYSLYADIDDKIFNGLKPYDSIREIAVSEFDGEGITKTFSCKINKSSAEKTELPFFCEAWEKIKPIIFNKTVIMFDANFTISVILRTFDYLINKNIPKTKPQEKYFPNLLTELKAIRFDFICLSLVLRRLFNDLPDNKLYNLCKTLNINYENNAENNSKAIITLLNKVIDTVGTNDLLELKQLSGITLGQLMKNEFMNKPTMSKINEVSFDNGLISYENNYKYFYPCLPITDDNAFRTFDFNSLKANKE